MNDLMKTLLSLSVSGTLLFLLILGLKQLYKNKFSRRWQYYIWLIVILRFLLPFAPETTLVGSLFENTAAITPVNEVPTAPAPNTLSAIHANSAEAKQSMMKAKPETQTPTQIQAQPNGKNITAAVSYHSTTIYACLLFAWTAIALAFLVRKIAVYQRFIRYVKANNTGISDIKTLNLLSDCKEKLHIKAKVELQHNSFITSPIMIGFFHPCIVLPDKKLKEKELSYIFIHELSHYKQWDMFYKWLVQIVVCIHWFNPFVYLLEKEVNKACELSCDEAVISMLDNKARHDYGDTLLSFVKPNHLYANAFTSVTLSEGAEQLKERLGAIMNYKKGSKTAAIITTIFTITFCCCFLAIGAYAAPSANDDDTKPASFDDVPAMETLEIKGKTYYLVANEAQLRAIGTDVYGMNQNYMQQADIQLSAEEWKPIGTWDNPFTGTYNGNGFEIAGLTMTDPDAELVGLFGVAKNNAQIYNITLRDFDTMSAGRNASNISAGAIVAVAYGARAYDNFVYPKGMDKDEDWQDEDWNWNDKAWEDENWVDKAWEDENWDWDDKALINEYASFGIEHDGKSYYYDGELVKIIKDQRPDSSFYMLDINSKGTVSIKVIRNAENEITGVSYMNEEEVAELLEKAM